MLDKDIREIEVREREREPQRKKDKDIRQSYTCTAYGSKIEGPKQENEKKNTIGRKESVC